MRRLQLLALVSLSSGAMAQVCPVVEPLLDIGLDAPASHSALFDEDGAGPNPARLMLSGGFTRAGGASAPGFARWDGDALSGVVGTPAGPKGAMRTFDDGTGLAVYAAGAAGVLHRYNGSAWDQLAVPQFNGFDGVPESFAAFDPDGPGPRPLGLFALVHYTGQPLEQESVLWRYDNQGWYRLSGPVPRGKITAYDPDGAGPENWQLFHTFNVQRLNPARTTGFVRRLHQDHWELVGYTSGADTYGIAEATAMYFGATPVLVVSGGLNAITRDGSEWVYGDRAAAWDGTRWRPFDGFFVIDNVSTLAPTYANLAATRLRAMGPSVTFGSPSSASLWEAYPYQFGPEIRYAWSSVDAAEVDSVSLLREFDPDGVGPRAPQLVLSGEFRTVDQLRRPAGPFVVREADGTWKTFVEGHAETVRSLLVYDHGLGRELFASGHFREKVSAWNGEEWRSMEGGLNIAFFATPIASFRDQDGWGLYTLGYRSVLTQVYRRRHGQPSWQGLGNVRNGFSQPDVYGLVSHDADGAGPEPAWLYMGGRFDRIGSFLVPNLARWNGNWNGVDGFLGGEVRVVKSFDDGSGPALYVGGFAMNVGGSLDVEVTRLRNGVWENMPALPIGYRVTDLALDNTTGPYLLVAVLAPAGPGDPKVMRLENGAWVDLNAPTEIDATVARNIQDADGPSLIVGRHRYTSGAWERLEPYPDGRVLAISPVFDDGHGPSFYIGGEFETIGGSTPVGHIARVRICPGPLQGACYANCDGSEAQPVLNAADFTCFLQRYAAGDEWANCDGSGSEPVLNVADFACFVQRFAAGCR